MKGVHEEQSYWRDPAIGGHACGAGKGAIHSDSHFHQHLLTTSLQETKASASQATINDKALPDFDVLVVCLVTCVWQEIALTNSLTLRPRHQTPHDSNPNYGTALCLESSNAGLAGASKTMRYALGNLTSRPQRPTTPPTPRPPRPPPHAPSHPPTTPTTPTPPHHHPSPPQHPKIDPTLKPSCLKPCTERSLQRPPQ